MWPSRGAKRSGAELVRLVAIGYKEGVRKVKLLGGEPLIRADLPQLIAELLRLRPGRISTCR